MAAQVTCTDVVVADVPAEMDAAGDASVPTASAGHVPARPVRRRRSQDAVVLKIAVELVIDGEVDAPRGAEALLGTRHHVRLVPTEDSIAVLVVAVVRPAEAVALLEVDSGWWESRSADQLTVGSSDGHDGQHQSRL